jgi:hypothetical protein
LPELPFHDRRQEVKAEARDCRTTADRQQRHLQRVRGIATVWCRGGCHQEGLRRPEEAGFFAQICGDLRVLAFVFYSSSFCGVDGMAFIWHSHGHDVCSIRPLDFFHAPWQRIIEPGLERITAPLKVKSLQPSSTLQFFFNSAFFSKVRCCFSWTLPRSEDDSDTPAAKMSSLRLNNHATTLRIDRIDDL